MEKGLELRLTNVRSRVKINNVLLLIMSASRAINIDKQYSTLHLIGGNDVNPNFLRKGMDLRVEGGALIKKSLVVMGNLSVDTFMSGDMAGNLFTTSIQEAELGEGIMVVGDVVLDEDNSFIGNLQSDLIEGTTASGVAIPKIMGDVEVCGNITVMGVNVGSDSVVGPQEPGIPDITDSSGGSGSATLSAPAVIVGGGDASVASVQNAIDTLTNNVSSLNDKISEILTALRSHGLIAT
jgi:hypothetical protein